MRNKNTERALSRDPSKARFEFRKRSVEFPQLDLSDKINWSFRTSCKIYNADDQIALKKGEKHDEIKEKEQSAEAET
ncbi:hypothetical protein [Leptospira alexanderi]|uniref:hypothetical protein n=1 Tax=Leptospira alexanderi TaxID=100053 RepID=UPI0009910C7D|nr:hypothetical protein [Leptospira alexanderi]